MIFSSFDYFPNLYNATMATPKSITTNPKLPNRANDLETSLRPEFPFSISVPFGDTSPSPGITTRKVRWESSETSVPFPCETFRLLLWPTDGKQSWAVTWQSSRSKQPVMRMDITKTSPLRIPGNMTALKWSLWPRGGSKTGGWAQMACMAGFRQPRELTNWTVLSTSPPPAILCNCTSLSFV